MLLGAHPRPGAIASMLLMHVFCCYFLLSVHFSLMTLARWREMKEEEEAYTASREAVDRAEILGKGQAGEERGGC